MADRQSAAPEALSPSQLPPAWTRHLEQQAQDIQNHWRWRQRSVASSSGTIDFASNDYLGLARDAEIAAALARAAEEVGTGAGSAQLLGGYQDVHQTLETELARWVNRPAAVLFSTGYMANLGLLSGLAGRGDAIIQDKLNHASLIDGAQLSGARLLRYPHANIPGLKQQLALPARRRLVVTESLFSMDGDTAPLTDVAQAATQAQALLCVDEAHALGVVGPEGAGACADLGLTLAQAPVIVGTFGKSLGTFGAFVAGPTLLIDLLVNRARSYIYTTAPPPALAAATLISLQKVQRDTWRRDRLATLIQHFRRRGAALGLNLGKDGHQSASPIQPVILGDASRALAVSRALLSQGFHVPAIRPPTVPRGLSRLRVSLNAGHQLADVDRLLTAIATLKDSAH